MGLTWDPGRWGVPEIETAARRVLDGGLGSGVSAIVRAERSWSPEVAGDLRHRIVDNADEGQGAFMSKLKDQLSGAGVATHLLCAELLFLQGAPLTNVGAEKKRARIDEVLSWCGLAGALPEDMDLALRSSGVFNGGVGFNVQIWHQVGWLLAFVEHWWRQLKGMRDSAIGDPWVFRDVVASMDKDQPGIRNSLLYLAFPQVFFPIVNKDHKRAIRDAFVSIIGGPSGNDPVATDRDLLAIRTKQLEAAGGGPVNYYFEPYLSQWWRQRDPGTERAWLVRPRQGGRELARAWVTEGFVSLQADRLGNIIAGADRQTVLAEVESGYQHLDYAQRVTLANEYHRFLTRMRPGDIVTTVADDDFWVGKVEGDVEDVAKDSRGRLHRSVDWKTGASAFGDLPAPLSDELDKQGTVVDLTGALDVLRQLLDEVEGPPPDGDPGDPLPLPPATPELAARLYVSEAWLQELIDLLQDRRHVVLYGPPGTGKTYVADAVARHLTDGEAVRLVQFHPSYSYEDFFEGFRPSIEDGGLGFRLTPGPLRRLAADAALNPRKPYFLIIDEINRANLPKVFGELYYLLEYRRKKIYLQYSPHEEFALPANLYLIGTMNTADKSIALLDAAIRRRFAFVEMHPDSDPVRDLLDNWLAENGKAGDERGDLLRALNAAMGERERDFKIGPSYLMNATVERPGGLERVWKYSILPLLQEHFYGRPEAARLEETFGLAALRASLSPTLTVAALPGAGSAEPDGQERGE